MRPRDFRCQSAFHDLADFIQSRHDFRTRFIGFGIGRRAARHEYFLEDFPLDHHAVEAQKLLGLDLAIDVSHHAALQRADARGQEPAGDRTIYAFGHARQMPRHDKRFAQIGLRRHGGNDDEIGARAGGKNVGMKNPR